MQVILTEKIDNLGDLGSTVNVKPGYARNYLIPTGKALRASAQNLEKFEKMRADLEKAAKERADAAALRQEKLEGLEISIIAKAGDGGKLFGSIGTRDIAEAIASKGIEVGKHEVRLPHGVIRELGEYEIDIHLHTDVNATIKLVIIEEAEK